MAFDPHNQQRDQTSLAQWLTDLQATWANSRKVLLEGRWQANLDAMNRVSNGLWKVQETEDWRSATFVPVTHNKVMSAYSIISDVMLQGGKLPFALLPSPWDNLVLEDLPDEEREIIEDKISDMEQIIHQQMAECDAVAQLLSCILSAAIYGETCAKRYVHQVKRSGYRALEDTQVPPAAGMPGGQGQTTVRYEPFETVETAPGWGYVSVWQIFRDLESDDLQAGVGVFHYEPTSAYLVKQKEGGHGIIKDAIQRVISRSVKSSAEDASQSKVGQEPNILSLPPGLRNMPNRTRSIPSYEFWGRVPVEICESFEQEIKSSAPVPSGDVLSKTFSGEEVEIMAEMVDGEIIRYVRTPPGGRPFYRAVWEKNLDEPGGLGVPDNLKDVQMVLNGMVRTFEDNKKLSANVLLAVKEEFLGLWDKGLVPGKSIPISDAVDDVRKAIQQVIIQDVGATLLDGIALFERYADEASMLPKILQGAILDKQKPDTAFELNQLQSNAGKYLGSVIRNFDQGLIEPLVKSFYDYNMRFGKDQHGKGNYIARPLGFSSFQDKVLRGQSIRNFLSLVVSSEMLIEKADIDSLLAEVAKEWDLDPDQVIRSQQEQEQSAMARMQAEQAAATMQQEAQAAALAEVQARTEELKARAALTAQKVVTERATADEKQTKSKIDRANAARQILAPPQAPEEQVAAND